MDDGNCKVNRYARVLIQIQAPSFGDLHYVNYLPDPQTPLPPLLDAIRAAILELLLLLQQTVHDFFETAAARNVLHVCGH